MKKENRQQKQEYRIIQLLFLKCIRRISQKVKLVSSRLRETIEPLGENIYKMAFAGVETRNVTALTVRKDLTLWILILVESSL